MNDYGMLSVIIPVYNVEKYLEQCVNSVLEQTYKNLELLLIDDGSSDNSSELCDVFSRKDNRVRCFHKKNEGVSKTRNFGIEVSRGKYIAFVDSDDVIDIDFYEILIDSLIKTNSLISACDFAKEYKALRAVQHNEIPSPVSFENKCACMESVTSENKSITGYVWNKVWKRNSIGNIRFHENISINEDALFTFECIHNNVQRVCYTELSMYHYRLSSSSTTYSCSIEKCFEGVHAYEMMISLAKKNAYLKCLKRLCTGYIVWNEMTCERMLLNNMYQEEKFKNIQENINEKKDYISQLGFIQALIARSILKGWHQYCFIGRLKLFAKKLIGR